MNLLNKFKSLMDCWNARGLPVPLVRDKGRGSYTATMVVVSFGAAILLLLGKVTKITGDVDYNNVLWLLSISLSAYLGRKFQGDGKKLSLDASPEKKEGSNGN